MEKETITVLHVDDDSSFRDLAKTYLERDNSTLSVISEPSAAAGLEQLEQNSIDCIVSDFDMPHMDGLEFLDAVRSEYSTLPFILYTGKGSEEIASEAINSGIDAYYQKEVGTDQYTVLAQHITNLAEKYSAEQRLNWLEREKHVADGRRHAADEIRTDGCTESVSMTVVKEVAAQEGIDPIALTPPLYESIDPEALDALFAPQSSNTNKGIESITFTFNGNTITVTGNGQVTIDK